MNVIIDGESIVLEGTGPRLFDGAQVAKIQNECECGGCCRDLVEGK